MGVATELLGSFLPEDACVPRSRLVDLVAGVEKISRESNVLITCTGHAGNGNTHPTVIFDPPDPGRVDLPGPDHEPLGRRAGPQVRVGATLTGAHAYSSDTRHPR